MVTTDNITRQMLKRLLVAIVFGVAFGYIESAVVVYLRAIFHPDGFHFPMQVFALTAQGRHLLLTEIGREMATLVLIATGAWLFGRNRQEFAAYSLLIFAVWDIFYYIWLKVLLDWPATLLDWDILFLIPVAWASPVLYPVLVSMAMFLFAVMILVRSARGRSVVVTRGDLLGWLAAAVTVVVSFCLPGVQISQPDYASHFHPSLFAAGYALGIAACLRSFFRQPAALARAS
ncbi:MAG: hypothetical protein JW955_02455 [Sedimentisphaerales bacterium]|nr:hypothetical protein [Sedimentisphaerales bacterium]